MRAPTLILLALSLAASAEPVSLSGIYPHLAFFNDEGECGTGALVPWADRLWAVTYAPHQPKESSDKLYEINNDLELIVRPESVGGTPANRMIHRETNQLIISRYLIDAQRNVRTIPAANMFGRLTGNARHLAEPEKKAYFATMEEGIYEVDLTNLAVKELWTDEQAKGQHRANLPGYHGKGLFSGQGRLIYSNNGEHGDAARKLPATPSGVLAEWDGKASIWNVVRRNQFTEVTGPGGIYGNENPATDPVWAIGWDHRSLILQCLAAGKWHTWRLPKGSHSYDGAHGWNTEWPRIRDIGTRHNLLMTMHGTLWHFPKTFTPTSSAGIAPRSNYLKVVGDFTAWNGRIVFGCDDTAKSEFLNKRAAKGTVAAPQSQSNLWFVEPAALDQLGPVIGRGAVWVNEAVAAGVPSDPFLFSGYDLRALHLTNAEASPLKVTLEADVKGDGTWSTLRELEVPAGGYHFHAFEPADRGVWIRLTPAASAKAVSAVFTYRNRDTRSETANALFDGLAKPSDTSIIGGTVRARAENARTLAFGALSNTGTDIGYYELDAALKLTRKDDAKLADYHKTNTTIAPAAGILEVDAASVIFIDDDAKRWRLPKGDAAFDQQGPFGAARIAREVATERDVFNAHGSIYELPARNAGGFALVRPIATHNRAIHDFCSYRGLLILTGVAGTASNPHIIRSEDGKAALWAGAVDDLWQLGKPRGRGGPWLDSQVKAAIASDPYLMTAYDKKSLTLQADRDVAVRMEIDITGTGTWVLAETFNLTAKTPLQHSFPAAFSAYWVRFVPTSDCGASAQLLYE
jgi:hypothetical protein